MYREIKSVLRKSPQHYPGQLPPLPVLPVVVGELGQDGGGGEGEEDAEELEEELLGLPRGLGGAQQLGVDLNDLER